MQTFSRDRGRLLLLALFAALLVTATVAFTNTNTVTAKKAGDGAGAISGYTVNAVSYGLNAVDATKIDSVTFTLNGTATTVKAKLVQAGTDWYSCSLNAATPLEPNDWTCATTVPQATVVAADELRVVAVE